MKNFLLVLLIITSLAIHSRAQSTLCSPNYKEIYDFREGDNFIYSNISISSDFNGTTYHYTPETITILKKNIIGDTITYFRQVVKYDTIYDTLVIHGNTKYLLDSCDSSIVLVNSFLKFQNLDTIDIYAQLRIYDNDSVRVWENNYPTTVKGIFPELFGGYYTKKDSTHFEPFQDICGHFIVEFAKGAGLIFESHFCFEIGTVRKLMKKINGSDTTLFHTASLHKQGRQPIHLSISPNPAGNEIKVNFHAPILPSFSIKNSHGTAVISGKFEEQNSSIDISYLPSGTYFLMVNSSDSRGVMKFIKE